MSDVERLLAYEEIRQLASRYAVAVDARDLDALVELFVDDVVGRKGRIGHDALRELFEVPLTLDRYSILFVGNHVINLHDADHATGTVYCHAQLGDDDRWAHQYIAYHDVYERRAGRWYFVGRDHRLFYGVDVDERPYGQAPANWPKRPVGRGTVPECWPSWHAFWGHRRVNG